MDVELSFEKISHLLRDERRTHDKLVSVPSTFYEDMVEYLKSLREEISRLKRIDSESTRVRLLQDEYKKISRKFKSIYKTRERKIIFLVFSKLSNEKIDLTVMTPKEVELFERLFTTIKEWRESIYAVPTNRHLKRDYKVVHVLEDLLEFIDNDKIYNLRKGDIVTLQRDTADLLAKNEKVKILI